MTASRVEPDHTRSDSGPFRVGDVVSYEPAPRFPDQRDTRWCREGTALAVDQRGEVVLLDTYWGSMSDAHLLSAAELASAELLFNVFDYDEIDRYARHSGTWEKYAPADRRKFTSQHGLQSRWFVRKGATEDLATQIANAQAALADRVSDAESAARRVEWAREDLAKLQAQEWATS